MLVNEYSKWYLQYFCFTTAIYYFSYHITHLQLNFSNKYKIYNDVLQLNPVECLLR